MSDVYPLEGNESLIGFDFLDLSRPGNKEAKEAYDRDKTVLTNPFKLIQGGYGMGGRAPVILQGEEGTELWGLVTVTIDFDNLMQVLKLDNLEGMGVNYEISFVDDKGENQVMKASGILDDPIRWQFAVRNLTWELAVSPTKGWISVWRVVLSAVILLIISVFAGVFTNILFRVRDTNVMLLKLSNTDQLTGCLNRRAYETAISDLPEMIKDDFIYISADLNGLKRVNDTLGHLAGDELIIGAKDCLQEVFGDIGKVYRVGGDEFSVLINANENTLKSRLEKLTAVTKAWHGKKAEDLSFSIGCVLYRDVPDATPDMIIRMADEKMYEEKQAYYQSTGLERRLI